MFDEQLPVTVSNQVLLSSNTFSASVQLSACITKFKKVCIHLAWPSGLGCWCCNSGDWGLANPEFESLVMLCK